ncbi:MAG: hypothetical protein FJW38_31990 [Acidobacteria bacterium]|nr:hypothetical protein [Acidobacteriota bacterium]MBM3758582.1 hypothetical protein [Acidobacteriota bacterium]
MTRILSTAAAAALLIGTAVAANHGKEHTSAMFQGPKANTGAVMHSHENGKNTLRVTPEFKVPDTPAPTWRIVDSKGQIYTLDAFKIKGGEKREISVPSYVRDIARVQVYCAWAEVLLGETSFSSPVK